MAFRITLISVGVLLALIAIAIARVWTPDLPLAELRQRWAPPPSQFVQLDGMEVHVRDQGPREDPTPIVLIHGTGSSLHTWQVWADRLKGQHRVISFDRPGFGLTGPNPSGDYSMRYYADFTARLLDQLGVKRAILVGNSSGGYVAWRYAVAYPDRVAAVVLLAPGGMPRSTPLPAGLRMAMSPAMGPILEHILPRAQADKGLKGTWGDPSKVPQEALDRSYELALRPGNRKALGETLRQGQGGREAALIAQVKAPTLIIWGTKDSVVPLAPNAERFHREIAGSTLVVLPGVGHMSQEEDPDDSLKAFGTFLQDHDLSRD